MPDRRDYLKAMMKDTGSIPAAAPVGYGLPTLPRGRMRFMLPLLLIAPMPLLSAGTAAWSRFLHGREAAAVSDRVGALAPGMSARWSAEPLLPWSAPLRGVVTLEAATGTPSLACRSATWSVEGSETSFFHVVLCRDGGAGAWRVRQDGAARLAD